MILFRRILPLFFAILTGYAFYVQSVHPSLYPDLASVPVVLSVIGSIMIAWRRMEWRDVLEKMSPLWIFQLSIGFSQILLETPSAHVGVSIGGALGMLIGLELLFLYAYDPAAYPMNGLSYFNIALVPAIMYLAMSTSWGLWVFVHTSWMWHVALGAFLGTVLFRTTGHPGATAEQNRVWMVVGCVTGVELAWITLHLPLGMSMQGAISAIVATAVLRVRRYLYDPRPPKLLERIELIGVMCSLLMICSTAKWI